MCARCPRFAPRRHQRHDQTKRTAASRRAILNTRRNTLASRPDAQRTTFSIHKFPSLHLIGAHVWRHGCERRGGAPLVGFVAATGCVQLRCRGVRARLLVTIMTMLPCAPNVFINDKFAASLFFHSFSSSILRPFSCSLFCFYVVARLVRGTAHPFHHSPLAIART